MPIQVIFDKNGFHHPAFGRMGRGKGRGLVYTLPDFFAADGMLPATAQIISSPDELDDALEGAGQRKPVKPNVVDDEQMKKAEKAAKAKSASEEQGQPRTRRVRPAQPSEE